MVLQAYQVFTLDKIITAIIKQVGDKIDKMG